MPPTRSKRARRVFDREIARAIARWEVLRRTRAYRDTVDAWLKPDGDGRLEDGVVMTDISQRYEADCARFGVRLLFHYDTEVSDEAMAAFPIFADTPRRQGRPKYVITREQERHAPPDQQAMLKALADKQERAYQAKVFGHPNWSQRTRERHFGDVSVPPGPCQLPSRWVHLDNLRWYLSVLDLRRDSVPFARVAKQLGISVHQAKRAWRVAGELVDAGLEPSWASIEGHLGTCTRCRWSQKETVADHWCPEGRRLARSAGVLMPSRREPLGRNEDVAVVQPRPPRRTAPRRPTY
jgi:hypothetical protein